MRRQFGEKVGSTWGGGGEKVRHDGMMQGERREDVQAGSGRGDAVGTR